MKISELSRETGVPVATLKFYLREGLLQPGKALSRTSADYGDEHVERVRLVRALTDVGGLSLATVGRVLAVIDEPGQGPVEVLRVASRSLYGEEYLDDSSARDEEPASPVASWLAGRGWLVTPQDPAVAALEKAWAACETAGLGLTEEHLDRYADASEHIAQIDVSTVPRDPSGAVRQVILGTVLIEPVLGALRRLAQQHVARTMRPPTSP